MDMPQSIDYEEAVRQFQQKYRHYITLPEDRPTLKVPDEVIALRVALIEEEYEEVMAGIMNGDIVETADGIADLIYVLVGAALAFGIPINRVFTEVHNSNMTKLSVQEAEASIGAKYGNKTPKGANYLAPDIRGILFFPQQLTQLEEKNWKSDKYNPDGTLKYVGEV